MSTHTKKYLLNNGFVANPFGLFDAQSDFFDRLDAQLPKQQIRFLTNGIVSKVENDKLEIAINVIGHDPKKVNVELTEDRIYVKAESDKENKLVTSAFVDDLDETLKLGKDFNGLSAKATINNGILHITIDKKEESKPKKLSITF